jgi:hypothetical protein
MLKCNYKIWAIVLALCLIGQFFITQVPVWIENSKREQASESANATLDETESVEDKEQYANETKEEPEHTSESNAGTSGAWIGIAIFVILLLAFIFTPIIMIMSD